MVLLHWFVAVLSYWAFLANIVSLLLLIAGRRTEQTVLPLKCEKRRDFHLARLDQENTGRKREQDEEKRL